MYELPKWRSVERFDPYGLFNNETNDFGREYLLSKSKVFCENHGSLLNVFDPDSALIIFLVQIIQRKKDQERFHFKLLASRNIKSDTWRNFRSQLFY